MPSMTASGWGRIVNLGTVGSHRPGHLMPHYYSAKGALATLGVSLMQELAGSGVTVNTVSPGLIHTPELEAGYRLKAEKRQAWRSHLCDPDKMGPQVYSRLKERSTSSTSTDTHPGVRSNSG